MNSLFDDKGRRIPFEGMRVFNKTSKWYYQIKQPEINYERILNRTKDYSEIEDKLSSKAFERICDELKQKIQNTEGLENLFGGVHVPFVAPKIEDVRDLGEELGKVTLPAVANSFTSEYPDLHCKAILQGSSKLEEEIRVNEDSRFEKLQNALRKSDVVGWYFPQALQEYDIESQRQQMKTLPMEDNLCLSGHSDTAAALVGSPGLLIHEDCYPPVLCLSALEHHDPKLMLCFKAYGHHLEFWCMSQMLTPTMTQVSEQWTGGLTVFLKVH